MSLARESEGNEGAKGGRKLYMREKKQSESRQVDKNLTFQVRVDKGWWKILSELRTDTRMSFKDLIEDALVNCYGIGKDGKPESYITDKQVNNNFSSTRN